MRERRAYPRRERFLSPSNESGTTTEAVFAFPKAFIPCVWLRAFFAGALQLANGRERLRKTFFR
jgi:hypothetical protein